MDIGQMMAVMPQMPVNVAAPQAGEAVLSDEQAGGAFAGLLQGMSTQKSVQVMVAKQAVSQSMPRPMPAPMTAPEMMNDVMTALLTTAGSNEKQTIPVQADSNEVQTVTSSLQDNTVPESQNVMQDVNGTQLAMLLSQLPGRIPEAGITAGGQSESPHERPQTDRGVATALESAVAVQARGGAAAPQKPATVSTGTEVLLRPAGDTPVPTQVPILAPLAVGKEPLLTPSAGIKSAPTSQNQIIVTESDKQVLLKPADVSRPAVKSPLEPVEKGVRQPEVAFEQVRDSFRVVTESQRHTDSLATRSPVVFVEPVVSAITDVQEPEAVVQDGNEKESEVYSSKEQVVQSRVAMVSPHAAATRLIQVPVQENELAETPALPSGTAEQLERLQTLRSAAPTASLSAAVVSAADGRPESVRLDPRETGKTRQSEQVDTVKIIAAVSSGEKQTSSEGNETPDRDMDGNFPSQLLHQQVKTEGLLTAKVVTGAVQTDASRAAPAPEQVVQQVRDRLVNHDTKPGTEQIVLRLSPEHLGELKVNLSLEGQRLKVEIVAENRMVRDSLMQHTDTLKESLSRQNIKMDSFEVTTGGNGSTDGGRGQGDWRELAQQRQHDAWMPNGGYRVAKLVEPAIAAYQLKSEHTMVDLHY